MAKPTLALIPATQGSKFYSVLPSNGVGDFDFTRSGSATRINKDGLIETVSNGVSRLNYPLVDGVVNGCPSHLLEPTKQNVLQRSEEFDNAYWINNGVTINANQTISPSGQLNADLLTGVSGGFGVVRFSTWSATNKVASCFAKKGSTNLFKIANVSSSNRYVLFDLSNGTVSEESVGWTGFIENYGNGWYRCSITGVIDTTGAIDFAPAPADNDFLANAVGESIYLYGGQLEINSSYATSYIPTEGSTVTRNQDVCTNGGSLASINSTEGVLYAEIAALANSGTYRSVSLSNGTNANRVNLTYSTASNILLGFINVNGVNTSFTFTVNPITDFVKCALKYKNNDCSLWVNGVEISNSTSQIAFPINTLTKLSFTSGSSSSNFFGKTKALAVWKEALSDSELQSLTTI